MNYDGQHLMTQLVKFKDREINVIAATLEKYICFKLKKPGSSTELMFLDF